MMRGTDKRSGELFSYVDLEQRVRTDHPLRVIREVVSTALAALSGDLAGLYSGMGRPSIPPEMLLRALLLQAFYSIRSERQLMERLEFDLLFRWFVGLGVDEPVWDHSSFSKNRDRLLDGDIAAKFLAAVLAQPRVKRLLSSAHFSVDGTLIGRRSGTTTEAAPGSQPTGVAEELQSPGRHRAMMTAAMTAGTGAATQRPPSRARSARTRPMRQPPTRMPCYIARGRAWR